MVRRVLFLRGYPVLSDLWKRTVNPDPEHQHRLAQLVQTHRRLVAIARETEASYSLILQWYYGSAVRRLEYDVQLLLINVSVI